MKYTAALLAVASLSVSTAPVLACSAFLLKGGDYQIIGFNENWKHLPGMVVVNKRGIEKGNLRWADMVAAQPGVPGMKWTAKYGSITFNVFGIDLPCYGMTERGLFLVELFLDKTYSQPDPSRHQMFWAQWIQYQLDNYATVDELVRHLSEAPVIDWWPQFPGSHFFVADAVGHTAAIEFIDGKPVVSAAEKMPQPILCNQPYQQELADLAQFKNFGGDRYFNEPKNNWNVRIRFDHIDPSRGDFFFKNKWRKNRADCYTQACALVGFLIEKYGEREVLAWFYTEGDFYANFEMRFHRDKKGIYEDYCNYVLSKNR